MSNGYFCVGKYQISHLCLESYPCQHFVIGYPGIEKPIRIKGHEIYQLLKDDGCSSSHFDQYSTFLEALNSDIPTEKKEEMLNYIDSTFKPTIPCDINSSHKRLEKLKSKLLL